MCACVCVCMRTCMHVQACVHFQCSVMDNVWVSHFSLLFGEISAAFGAKKRYISDIFVVFLLFLLTQLHMFTFTSQMRQAYNPGLHICTHLSMTVFLCNVRL